MKKRILFVALAACIAAATATQAQNQAQTSKPIPSKVTEATVFLQGAELTLSAEATLTKGANEISIEGLSPGIDQGSLKINIGRGVVVSAFEYSIDYLSSSKAAPARLKVLKDSIDIYEARLDRTGVDIKVNSAMQGYLETGIAKNVSGSEEGLGIDELRKTMDYYKAKSEEILNTARDLQRQKTTVEGQLARVRNQYNQETGQSNKTSGILRLSLTAPVAGIYPVTITYYTPSASWIPYYDINVASTDRPIRIAAKSRVSQSTGLDWTNVRLTLSTAAPSGGKIAPLFSTWFLREMQQRRYESRAAGAMVQNSVSYDMARKEIVMEEAAPEPDYEYSMYDYVTTTDNAVSVTYNIDLSYSIPGNGKAQNIDLTTKEASADYKYYAAPKLDPQTYLIAEIADWQSLDLLSARANITYDGTYIGETWIDTSRTNEKLTLTLGTDKRVATTRELAKEFTSTRAIGSSTEQTFTYRITVRNGQTSPVNMVLKEQYPISTDRNITATLDTRTTTPWTVNKTDTGVVTWEDTFAPGQSRTYTISYTVKYPKEMRLNL